MNNNYLTRLLHIGQVYIRNRFAEGKEKRWKAEVKEAKRIGGKKSRTGHSPSR